MILYDFPRKCAMNYVVIARFQFSVDEDLTISVDEDVMKMS